MQTMSTNLVKGFLDLLDKHFSPNNQLDKMFNRNAVKVSSSYTLSMSSIIKSLNKKLTNGENNQTKKL